MRRINTIRGLGRLTPPLLCEVPGYGPKLTCVEAEQDLYSCRAATRSDFTREEWDNTPCAGPVLGPYEVIVTAVSPSTGYTVQAPPPAVTISDPERIRREQEDVSRREWYRYHQENERARKERERIEAARLERERIEAERVARLERERIQAEQEQRRIQEELERNRRQLAERQQTEVPANAPPGVETEKGGFPWWLLGLILATQ